jgi:hypothetical protein
MLLLVAFCCLAAVAFAQPKPRPGGPSKNPPALKLAASGSASTSYVACYFGSQWEWGRTPNNQYFTMNGTLLGSVANSGQGFSTSTANSTILEACNQAKIYNKISASFTAAYSAYSNVGHNYYIVSTQLYP